MFWHITAVDEEGRTLNGEHYKHDGSARPFVHYCIRCKNSVISTNEEEICLCGMTRMLFTKKKRKEKEVNATCTSCRKNFKVKTNHGYVKMFCSDTCKVSLREKFKPKRTRKWCKYRHCAESFGLKRTPILRNKKFCSTKCRELAKKETTLLKAKTRMRKCFLCGNDYPPIYDSGKHKQKYCSQRCINENKIKPVDKTCENCKETFTAKKETKKYKQRFCSRKCIRKNKRKTIDKACENCKDTFTATKESSTYTQRFCSKRCSSIFKIKSYESKKTQ